MIKKSCINWPVELFYGKVNELDEVTINGEKVFFKVTREKVNVYSFRKNSVFIGFNQELYSKTFVPIPWDWILKDLLLDLYIDNIDEEKDSRTEEEIGNNILWMIEEEKWEELKDLFYKNNLGYEYNKLIQVYQEISNFLFFNLLEEKIEKLKI